MGRQSLIICPSPLDRLRFIGFPSIEPQAGIVLRRVPESSENDPFSGSSGISGKRIFGPRCPRSRLAAVSNSLGWRMAGTRRARSEAPGLAESRSPV